MKRVIQKSDDSILLNKNIINRQLTFNPLDRILCASSIQKCGCLPKEIVDIILEYQGYHIWRNGKIMYRLNMNDTKYDDLKNMNIIKKNKNSYKATLTIMKNHSLYKYTIEQKIGYETVHWYMNKYQYCERHLDKKSYNKPYVYETCYVFGKNATQNLPMLPMDFTYKK